MSPRSFVSSALAIFWSLLTTVVVTAFCLMLVVMAIQVISRYTLGLAVPWTDEVSRYLFLAEIFLGSVLALRYQEHIRVTIVTDRLPPKIAHLVAALADLIGIVVLIMIMGGAWNMMERTAGVFASTFQMSFSYVYLVQFIAALLMVILLTSQCQRHLRGKTATPPAKPWSD